MQNSSTTEGSGFELKKYIDEYSKISSEPLVQVPEIWHVPFPCASFQVCTYGGPKSQNGHAKSALGLNLRNILALQSEKNWGYMYHLNKLGIEPLVHAILQTTFHACEPSNSEEEFFLINPYVFL